LIVHVGSDFDTICEEIFTLLKLHEIQKKSTVNDNKSKR